MTSRGDSCKNTSGHYTDQTQQCSLAVYFLLHALRRLPRNVDQFDHLKLGFDDVQMVVQTGALAPLRHYGQLGLCRVPHEQKDVHVTSFSER